MFQTTNQVTMVSNRGKSPLRAPLLRRLATSSDSRAVASEASEAMPPKTTSSCGEAKI